MNYKLDPAVQRAYAPWLRVFSSLSLPQFRKLTTSLDFPFDPSDDVRQIAHDFFLTFHYLIHIFESDMRGQIETLIYHSETTSFHLLDSIGSETGMQEKIAIMFLNMFAHLETRGHAEAVYQWGQQTHSHYDYKSIDALSAVCILLGRWALMYWWVIGHSADYLGDAPHWEPYLEGVRSMVLRTMMWSAWETLMDVPFSDELCLKLLTIILDYEIEKMAFRSLLQQIEEEPKSVWEFFAYNQSSAWLSLEGGFRINLRQWYSVKRLLSAEELDQLYQWALDNQSRYAHLTLDSLVSLADFHTPDDQK